MMNNMLSVEQAAEMLDLHPRTVRRFIREGKLQARKVGGRWRVSKQAIDTFVGSDATRDFDIAQGTKESQNGIKGNLPVKVSVSAVVDIFVGDAEEAMRISNSIFAVMNHKDPMYGNARCDYVFYENELKARFILWGTPLFISQLLGLIAEIST